MFAHEGTMCFSAAAEKLFPLHLISDNSATSNFGFGLYFADGILKQI